MSEGTRTPGLSPEASIQRSFRTAVERAELELTFHDLRRIFLNRLRERGVSIDTAMALTGHKSLQTVLAHYREVSQEDMRKAVEALAPLEVEDEPKVQQG